MRFNDLMKRFLGQVRWPIFWTLFAAVSAVIGPGAPAVAAGVIELPQTGQTQCYNPTTNLEIPCTSASAAGQDGYYLAGVEWPFPRFTLSYSVVLDHLTGLEWPANASTPAPLGCPNGSLTWPASLSYVACLNNNDYLWNNDWRLPNVLELASLINNGQADPAAWLNYQGFSNVGDSYWTSTTYAQPGTHAWTTSIPNIFMGLYGKANFNGVWPVRGGQTGVIQVARTGQTTCYDVNSDSPTSCGNTFGQDGNAKAGAAWPNPRFSISNGTVTDNLTGLVWLRNARCPSATKTWPEAITWVGTIQTGDCGLNDGSGAGEWRLPNVFELLSLMDFEYSAYAVSDTTGTAQYTNNDPFINVTAYNGIRYWTSTTSVADPTQSVAVNANDGSYEPTPKTDPLHVWPVFDNRKRLSISFSGTGSGSADADCSSGCWYPKNSTASLTAIPDSGSYFVWWSGGCSGLNALTTTTMDASKTCNAVFSPCSSPPIKNLQSGDTFSAAQGIQVAYNDSQTCPSGRTDTLELLMTKFSGDLIFDSAKNIILQGGWDCGQTGRWTSPAFIDGKITISDGSVTFDKVVIL